MQQLQSGESRHGSNDQQQDERESSTVESDNGYLPEVRVQLFGPGNESCYPQFLQYVCGTVTLIARFMGPTWGPPRADRTQVGPMWAT